MKNSAMGKVYNPAVCEDYWYKTWKKSDLFKAENNPNQPSFAILLPPSLSHGAENLQLGQALSFTIPDIIIRRKKMQGFNTLYLPELDRDGNAARLASRLGLALDWGHVPLSSNEEMEKTAVRVFVQLYREGNIYRGDYTHHGDHVGHRKNSQTGEEPKVSKQWFLKTAGMAKPALGMVRKGKIAFIPESGREEYFRWMDYIRDWCISRQLPVGYRIPAYYCADCRSVMVYEENPGKCDRCNSTSLTRDTDVLDTYFSSALWPCAALGWREQSQDFKDFYPTSLIAVTHDMIFFQVARMIMLGLHVCKNIPFREVLINGRIRGEKSRVLDKTAHIADEPLVDIVTEYGADALRFTLAILADRGQDTILSRDRVKGYRAFVNKIWNASRYVLVNAEGDDYFAFGNSTMDFTKIAKITDVDRWILNGLNNLVVKVNDLVDAYKLHKAANLIFRFFRYEYCNWYLEFSRNDRDNPDTRKILRFTLFRLLQLLHPFMPFITEEIYHKFKPGQNRFLMRTAFPAFSSDLVFPGEFVEVEVLKRVIKETRKTRTENKLDPKSKIAVFLKTESGKEKKALAKNMKYFDSLVGSAGTQIVTDFSGLPRGFKGACHNWEILLPLISDEHRLNVLARLESEAEILDSRIAGLENKLTGSDGIDNAAEPVTTDFKKNLRASLNRRDRIRKTVNDLS